MSTTTTSPPPLTDTPPPPSPADAAAANNNNNNNISSIKHEFPPPATTTTTTITTSRPQPPPPQPPPSTTPDADVIHVPSYSRWFLWSGIHECEVKFMPEFFDSRSPSKNPRTYMYYRNSIIKHYRRNPSAKITFTEVRKTLLGDVGSIRRVFDFLETWGLINYTPPLSSNNKALKWDNDKESNKSSSNNQQTSSNVDAGGEALSNREAAKRHCNGCKTVCSIACFYNDKHDLTLCARCYVRGNHRVGVNSNDFRRVEINEEARTDWSEKETLLLLEAIVQFGDDWKKVAQHVNGRNETDCVNHFIKLPFGEEYAGYMTMGEVDSKNNQIKDAEGGSENITSAPANKRMRLTPLADASNPIMAQAAFLAALTGAGVAKAAADAALSKLTEVEYGSSKGNLRSVSLHSRKQDAGVASNGGTDTNLNELEKACLDANSLLEKEELDVERAISSIMEVEMKKVQNKIVEFEELDLQVEKEWQQVKQVKNQLYADQCTLLFHKISASKTGEVIEGNVK